MSVTHVSQPPHLAVVLTLVFSLAGIALLPVLANPGDTTLSVSVDTDEDIYCCSENVTVTATITNSGNETAVNVTGGISWIPSGSLSWVLGGDETAPHTIAVGNITAGGSQEVGWTLHCEGPGMPIIKVTADADNAATVWQQKYIEQRSADLEVFVISPIDTCDRAWLAGESYNISFNITNIGCSSASAVTARIEPSHGITVVVNDQPIGNGVPWTTPPLGSLGPGESLAHTQEMKCLQAGASQIHVKPLGWDVCANIQMHDPYLKSKFIYITQYEPLEVTCDAEPNPTKHCHNVTFTAEASGGIPPYSWNWTFGDGNWEDGSDWGGTLLAVKHHYSNNTTEPLDFEACITVTDECGNTDKCCQNITVNPPLTMVSCNATPNLTKVGHEVNFTAEASGGVGPYTWGWDFDDGVGTSDVRDPTYTYNTAGNYTAIVTVTDSLENVASCNVTVEVFPKLTAWCDATPNPTKVCYNVTFTGGGVGGFPPAICNYTWEWDFGDGSEPVTGEGYESGAVIHHYAAAGNYTAVFTIWDDCLGNEASCNVTVQVNPPLEVTCDAEPLETKVCHNVTFTGTISGGVGPYQWTWDFDDGEPASGTLEAEGEVIREHHYEKAGNYTACFNVTDALENFAYCCVDVIVHPELGVECDVDPEVVHVCHEVQFSAERVGGVPAHNYTWHWDFGDGETSTLQSPTHTYMCVGNYTAMVTLTDDVLGNQASCNVTVQVIIVAPELYNPDNNETVLSRWVTFKWEDIGCVDYTLQVRQKDGLEKMVVNEETGKANTWSGWIMDGDTYEWWVIATDMCGYNVTSATRFFKVEDTYLKVTVTRPKEGDSWTGGSTEPIIWSTERLDSFSSVFGAIGDEIITVDLWFSWDGGDSWTSIVTDQPKDGVFPWSVPEINSNNCLIKAEASDGYGKDRVGYSGVFSITTPPVPPEPVTSYNITLAKGRNLISLPLIPESSNITDVLAGVTSANVTQVWAYDPTLLPGDPWLYYYPGPAFGTLDEMKDGVGYWVETDGEAILTVTGLCMPDDPLVTPPMYAVYEGWNLMGYKSIITRTHDDYLTNVAGKYSVIWGYDQGYFLVFPLGTGMLTPGQGYWIWMTQDGVIVPPGF